MKTIDIGGGQAVQRHDLLKNMLRDYDDASAAMSQTQASIRSWLKPLFAMQAAANFSGEVNCTAVGQSGRTYTLPEIGGALLVDQRDVPVFSKLGFTDVPSGSAPTGLRVGLVFLDTSLNEYMRYDGNAWAPVTLE